MSKGVVECVKNEHGGYSIPGCQWGTNIEAAFGKRDKPTLPEGWSRVFESHHDCAPAILIYGPGMSHDEPPSADRSDPVLTVHAWSLDVGYRSKCGEVVDDAKAFAAAVAVAAEDQAWLRNYEDTCCCDHECAP